MALVERRVFPRLLFNVEVQYHAIFLPEGEEALKARSKDISAGGIRLMTPGQLDCDTVLELKFFLPGSKEMIYVTGRVVWTDKFEAGTLGAAEAYDSGIEFIGIDPEDREKINQYVFPRM